MSTEMKSESVDQEREEAELLEAEEEDYEASRLKNIAANQALLSSLNLSTPMITPAPRVLQSDASSGRSKRRNHSAIKTESIPTRRSSRISAIPVDSKPLSDDDYRPPAKKLKQLKPETISEPRMPNIPTTFGAEMPKRDKNGFLVFHDWLEFKPNLTPEQMFKGGAFGGTYFHDRYSAVLKKQNHPDYDEFPSGWFEGLDPEKHLCSTTYDPEINRYGVKASQSITDWEKAGWIAAIDPRGWAQWYCRFYLGRRCADDERQIGRFLRCAGSTGRFRVQLAKKIMNYGGWDKAIEEGKILRQTLFHWGFDLNEDIYKMHAG